MWTAYLLIKFYLVLFGFMAAVAIYCGGWSALFGAAMKEVKEQFELH